MPSIAIVVSNLEFGGAQQQIVELANNLDSKQFEIHIVSLSNFVPLADNLRIPGKQIHVVRKYWKYDLSVVLRMAMLLRRLNVTLVHGFLYDAEIATRVGGFLARTPVVVGSERNCDYTIKNNQMLFYNLTKSWQHASVANSHAGASFNQQQLDYPASHYRVVHNGVNTVRFSPADGSRLRGELDIPEEARVVGVFGSFKEQKNHRLFFKVAAVLAEKYEDLHFLLVGDQLHDGMHGSDLYKEGLDRLVDELGIRDRCHFVGNQANVEEYYRVCDLTVLPSLHEGMPNVVLESLATGVPVVATDVADNSKLIIDGEVGLLVPSEDAGRLEEAIARLLDDEEMRARFGARAVQWINEQFSAEVMADKMGETYASLIECARSGSLNAA